MINFKEMKEYLKPEENKKFIFHDDILKYDDMLKLRELALINKTKFRTCFEVTLTNEKDLRWTCEVKCCKCNKIVLLEKITKSSLMELLIDTKHNTSFSDYICDTCRKKDDEEAKKEYKLYLKENMELANKNLERIFSCNYTFKNINKNLYTLKSNIIAILTYCDKNKLTKVIDIPYKEYLSTPYWKVVRKLKLRRANYKCELCNSSENLNVHHKTYKHKGTEICHLEDLIVLCQKCHAKFHDKLGD